LRTPFVENVDTPRRIGLQKWRPDANQSPTTPTINHQKNRALFAVEIKKGKLISD